MGKIDEYASGRNDGLLLALKIVEEDGVDSLFTYADGWDLDELHENIRRAVRKSVIVFEGD